MISCCLGCFSDNIDITPDRRFEIKGTISNSEGLRNPDLFSFAGYELYGYNEYRRYGMLGKGRLDASGDFDFVSLVPELGNIHILLNNDFSENYDDNYESVFILAEGLEDHEIHLPSISIQRAAKIKILFKNNSAIEEGSYQIIYTQPSRYLVYDEGTITELEEEYMNTGRITGEIANETRVEELNSLLGREVTVILNYEEQQDERIFIIEPGINSYEIEF